MRYSYEYPLLGPLLPWLRVYLGHRHRRKCLFVHTDVIGPLLELLLHHNGRAWFRIQLQGLRMLQQCRRCHSPAPPATSLHALAAVLSTR